MNIDGIRQPYDTTGRERSSLLDLDFVRGLAFPVGNVGRQCSKLLARNNNITTDDRFLSDFPAFQISTTRD